MSALAYPDYAALIRVRQFCFNLDMSDPGESLPSIDKLLAVGSRWKFPTGAFGKTCMLLVGLATMFAVIAWSVQNPWVSSLIAVLMAGVAMYALVRIFNFIEKNPAAAILEGSEYTSHQQTLLAYKGHPTPFQGTIVVQEPEQLPAIEQGGTKPDAEQPPPAIGGGDVR